MPWKYSQLKKTREYKQLTTTANWANPQRSMPWKYSQLMKTREYKLLTTTGRLWSGELAPSNYDRGRLSMLADRSGPHLEAALNWANPQRLMPWKYSHLMKTREYK